MLSRGDERLYIVPMIAGAALIGAVVAAVSVGGTARSIALGFAAVLVGAVLAATLVARFEFFILLLLSARATLDLADDGGTGITKPASLVAIMMIGASTAWLWQNRKARPRRHWSAFTIGVVGFACAAGLSLVSLSDPAPVAGDFLAIVASAQMFLCVGRLLMFGMPLRRLMIALLVAAIPPLVIGFVGSRLGLPTYHVKEGVRALRSTFVLSNNFANFLVPVILLSLSVGHRLVGWHRIGLYTIAGAGMIQLAMTYTRGAWIGFVVGGLIVALLENRRLIIGCLVLAAAALLIVPNFWNRAGDVNSDRSARRYQSSLEWRFEQWAEIINWNEQNRVTGIGVGMVIQLDDRAKAPHNDYVRAYVEMGVVGLGFYLLLIGGFIRAGLLATRRRLADWRGGLAVGILGYSVAFAVTSLAENLVVTIALMWYAMALAAVANFLSYDDPTRGLDGHPTAPLRQSSPVST
jgi:O-antigen ligase